MTAKVDREGKLALAAAARAFERAKRAGHVWISDESGMYETIEGQLAWEPPPPIHPDQLRII